MLESHTPNAKTNLAWLRTRAGLEENRKRISTQNPATSGFSCLPDTMMEDDVAAQFDQSKVQAESDRKGGFDFLEFIYFQMMFF